VRVVGLYGSVGFVGFVVFVCKICLLNVVSFLPRALLPKIHVREKTKYFFYRFSLTVNCNSRLRLLLISTSNIVVYTPFNSSYPRSWSFPQLSIVLF